MHTRRACVPSPNVFSSLYRTAVSRQSYSLPPIFLVLPQASAVKSLSNLTFRRVKGGFKNINHSTIFCAVLAHCRHKSVTLLAALLSCRAHLQPNVADHAINEMIHREADNTIKKSPRPIPNLKYEEDSTRKRTSEFYRPGVTHHLSSLRIHKHQYVACRIPAI